LLDKRTSAILFTILVFAGVLFIIYQARRPLSILIFSILFAYLLEPAVGSFQKRFHGSRTAGIAITYVILIGAISLFTAAAGPRIVHESAKLLRELPQLVDTLGSGSIAEQIGNRRGWNYETQVTLQRFLSDHRGEISRAAQTAAARIPGLAGNMLWLLLIPLFAVFVLKGKTEFVATITSLIESHHDRQFLRGVFDDIDSMLAAFIRAQLLLAGLSLLAYTIFLVSASFPFSFLIAAIAGVLDFIPVVGAVASASLIMGMTFVTGYKHWLLILVFLLIWRVLQDYLNSPLLMGRGLKLHPFAVILGVLICGEVVGVSGVFLSVPIMAGLRIIWKNWKQRRKAIEQDVPEINAARPTR